MAPRTSATSAEFPHPLLTEHGCRLSPNSIFDVAVVKNQATVTVVQTNLRLEPSNGL